MVNVLQRNMSAVIPNTSSHMALEEEESSGFVLHVEELRHNNSAASLSHHKEQKNTAQGFPHPWALPCSLSAKLCDSDLQWAVGMGTEPLPSGWDPPAEPRHAEHRLEGDALKALLGKQLLTAGKGKKAKPHHQQELQAKTTGAAEDLRHGKRWNSLPTQTSAVETSLVLQEVNPKLPLGLKLGTQSEDVGPQQSHSLNLKRNNQAQTLLWHCTGNTCLIWLKTPELTDDWYTANYEIYSIYTENWFISTDQSGPLTAASTLGGKRPHNDSKPCKLQI